MLYSLTVKLYVVMISQRRRHPEKFPNYCTFDCP